MPGAPGERLPIGKIAQGAGGHGTFHGDESPHSSDSSPKRSRGLTSAQAAERLKEDGPNILDGAAIEPFISILFTQMKNVIFLLTMCAAWVSYMMGDETKAAVLIGIVVFVCTINALGEYSAQDPGAALREQMASEPVTVIRDSKEVTVQVQELVVGDIVKVKMGDLVPADMLVLESIDLQTNEAVLTGEPIEKHKRTEPKAKEETYLSNMLYSGTSVVAGKGKGEILATGMRTQVGLIAKRLKAQGTANLNPLQVSINFLGKVIGMICMVVIAVATAVSFATGYQNPMSPCADDDDFCLLLSSANRGLIMAVSIIPHGLPFVVMIMLRVGSMEMASRHAVVTKRSSVDYLGATSVICTDKTGTLTQGKMTAQAVVGLCRREGGGTEVASGESRLEFYPLGGFSPNGGVFEASKLTPEAKKRMDTKFDSKERRQNFAEPGLPDLSTSESGIVGGVGECVNSQLAQAHLVCGFLNCYGTQLMRDKEGNWATSGNMTEAAVKVAAAKGGLWDEEGLGANTFRNQHARIPDLEIPFTSGRKMMATVHLIPRDGMLASMHMPAGTTHCAIIKGAPDRLLPRVSTVMTAKGTGTGKSPRQRGELQVSSGTMTDEERKLIEQRNDDLASRALRSLLVALCPLSAEDVDAMKKMTSADDRLEAVLKSPKLCYLSLWGIFDPPRAAVKGSVEECHTAGIRVVMITGDQRPTAMAIGQLVSIIADDRDPLQYSALCKELQMPTDLHPNLRKSPSLRRKCSKQTVDRLESTGEILRQYSGDSHSEVMERPPIYHGDSGNFGAHCNVKEDKEKDDKSGEPEYRSVEEIAELSSRVNVWARAQPTDKVALVDSLMQQGHVTAMTGDGVNDAPALRRADAGVAMGISGTAVSKNASDLILMDDDFSTIVAAVREGRRIYANTQKYVTFNLSVKAGECMCLMTAILTGVPMPIRGLQLLLNLLVTHILPPLSLAWERPEDYLMKVPPRRIKGDLVVSKVLWLFRWLPFILYMPCVVISCLSLGVWTSTGFVHANSLIGSSRFNAVENGRAACEIAGYLSPEGRFIDDAYPFHCLCNARADDNPFGTVEKVDQWGRTVEPEVLEAAFDPWTGRSGDLFSQQSTPWKDGPMSLLEACKDHRGVERWCWKDGVGAGIKRPWLPIRENCAAYGAQLGQSMSYVAIHVGEILTLLNFRMDTVCIYGFLTNKVYLGFLVFNLIMLSLFLYVKPISEVLGLSPLVPTRLAIALCFALLLSTLNEVTKIAYRRNIALQNEKLSVVALRKSLGTPRVAASP